MGSKEVMAAWLWSAAVCAYTAWRSLSGKGFRAGGPLTGRPRFTYKPGSVARYAILAVCLAGLIYSLFRFAGMLKSN
jgi:hypothetical protein